MIILKPFGVTFEKDPSYEDFLSSQNDFLGSAIQGFLLFLP